MIGGHERHCPRCGAGICRYNAEPFCRPCMETAGPGVVWHWSPVVSEWVRIPILKLEPPWEPEPGDIPLGPCFEPVVRGKTDNWGKWRKAEAVNG